MTCPDYDELIRLYYGGIPDPEVEEHVRTCPTCRADLTILDLVSAVGDPGFEVPEGLMERALERLPSPRPAATLGVRLRWAVLASATAACAFVLLGTLPDMGPAVAAALLLGSGVTSGLLRPRIERRLSRVRASPAAR